MLSWFSVTTSLGSVCLTTVLVDTPCGLPLPSQSALNVIVLKPPSLSPHRPVAKRGSPPKVCDYNPLPGRQITCPSIPLPHHHHQYNVLVGLRRRGLHALLCGGAVCAISHNLQSNSSRCCRRPMTSTPSNHKRLNLNGRYELRWRNFSPALVARNPTCHATPWMVTGRWQLGVAPATPYGRRLAAGNALYRRLLRLYVYNEEHLPPQE